MTARRQSVPPGPARSAWVRALCIALAAHASVAGLLLWGAMPRGPLPEASALRPMVEGALVQVPSAPSPAAGNVGERGAAAAQIATSVQFPVRAAAAEPTAAAVRRAAEALLQPAAPESQPQAMDTLLQKSRTLERISSTQEVSRMAGAIRDVMDLSAPTAAEGRRAKLGEFEFNNCRLTDMTRETDGPRTVVRETLSQPDGAFIEIEYEKTAAADSSSAAYRWRSIDADGPHEWSPSTAEDFDAALSHQRTFAVMKQFPLVEQLHREAVIPLLDKLAGDAGEGNQTAVP